MLNEKTSEKDIVSHSTDSSIFKVTPSDVFYPETVEDIKKIIKEASATRKTISVRAGGTCMSGASLSNGLILNLTKHMNKIVVHPHLHSADVEMGAMYRDLEIASMRHHMLLASYTSSKDICGVGGMIGNNASGEKSIRHGATIDNVYAVDVVLHDGEKYTFEEITESACVALAKEKTVLGNIYKEVREIYIKYAKEYTDAVGEVRKAASGYRLEKIYDATKKTWNLAKIFVGAQATLGIVTSAKLKLTDAPIYNRTVLIPVHDLGLLPEILKTVMAHHPEGVETFDVNTFVHAKKFLPTETLAINRYFSKGEKLLVIAQFSEASQSATDEQANLCVKALTVIDKNSRAEYVSDLSISTSAWAIRRSSFKVLRDADFDVATKKAVPCIEDIIVPISKFDIFIPKLINILQKDGIQYGFHGHIGDGALRVIPIFDFADKEKAVKQITKLCTEVFTLIKEMKGNTSADHGDGIIRTPFLKDFYGAELYDGVIVAIKDIFDPKRIFNPDKKIGIKKEDLVDKVRFG